MSFHIGNVHTPKARERFIPNPTLKLMDQKRKVLVPGEIPALPASDCFRPILQILVIMSKLNSRAEREVPSSLLQVRTRGQRTHEFAATPLRGLTVAILRTM